MKDVGARDRLVMAGLVVLGLLTVLAGVLSGRSTINYVLGRDARQAALTWATSIDGRLQESGTPSRVLDKPLHVLNAPAFDQITTPQNRSLPARANQGAPGFGLIAGLDRLTRGWFLSNVDDPNEFVSQLDSFAILTPSGKPLAVGGNLSGEALARVLGESDVKQAMNLSINSDAVRLADLPETDDVRVAFVPVTQGDKVSRVYAFTVDQSGAASLTNMALTVVTLTTSLLIVMGFSVPAVVASRRIRERWHAEDKIRFLAMHDSLTGLPNRLQFHQRTEPLDPSAFQ